MFEAPAKLLLGLLTGVVFGFLLQKGQVAKHSVVVRQLVLRDWTVAKVMGVAIAVGAVGVYALVAAGISHTSVKPAQMGGILAGAVCFGVGLAVLGHCPGTTVAAVGEGRKDALAGLAGMMVGAAVFVAGYPALHDLQRAVADLGKATWPSVTGTSPWPWILALGAVVTGLVALDRHRGHSTHVGHFSR